jgi:HTH-type transcriptional regulator/antitoxin HigA
MEQRALRPVDLTPIFGAHTITSLVLSGKRKLSKTHIRKLAEFFHVSPVVFLDEE